MLKRLFGAVKVLMFTAIIVAGTVYVTKHVDDIVSKIAKARATYMPR